MLHLAPADITFNGTTAIIFVQGCQGSERTFCHWSAWNWMSLLQYIAIKALQQLLQLHKGAKTKRFWGESRRSFSETWRNIAAHLQLPHGLYQPYSLHRGGATSAYQNGMSLYTLVTKGRWQHLHTARIYLDTGLQALAAVKLPSPSRLRIQAATEYF